MSMTKTERGFGYAFMTGSWTLKHRIAKNTQGKRANELDSLAGVRLVRKDAHQVLLEKHLNVNTFHRALMDHPR